MVCAILAKKNQPNKEQTLLWLPFQIIIRQFPVHSTGSPVNLESGQVYPNVLNFQSCILLKRSSQLNWYEHVEVSKTVMNNLSSEELIYTSEKRPTLSFGKGRKYVTYFSWLQPKVTNSIMSVICSEHFGHNFGNEWSFWLNHILSFNSKSLTTKYTTFNCLKPLRLEAKVTKIATSPWFNTSQPWPYLGERMVFIKSQV